MAAARSRTSGKNSGTKKQSSARNTAKKPTASSKKIRTASAQKKRVASAVKTIPVPKPKESAYTFSIAKEISVIVGFGIALLLFICCFQTESSSQYWLKDSLFWMFGHGCYVAPAALFFSLCLLIVNYGKAGLGPRLLAIAFFLSGACGISELAFNDGGIIGSQIEKILRPVIGLAGTYIVIIIFILIGIVLISGRSLVRMLKRNSKKAYQAVRSEQEILKGEHEIRTKERELRREQEKNRRLMEQKQRMEELVQAREEELAKRIDLIPVYGIGDVTVEPDENDLKLMKQKKNRKGGRPIKVTDLFEEEESTDSAAEFTGQIHFGNLFEQEQEIISGKHEEQGREPGSFDPLVLEDTEEYAVYPSFKEGESPADLKIHGELSRTEGSSSLYKQELPPDTVNPQALPGWKQTYSNHFAKDGWEENRTKTVRTSTGKVITVELDGPLGENKQSMDRKKREPKKEESPKIAPKEYAEPKEYVFPPITMLRKGSAQKGSKGMAERELKDTAIKLQQTLQNFGVGVTVTNISCGPSVTRYELQPEQGVKVSRITNLADDIKLNLAAADIRIEAPIPGKAAIGIEVPNKEKQPVMLRDLLESEEFKNHPSKIVFGAGRDIGGSIVLADIAKMPHLLIAGATGSGKSVCINTIIMSILYKAKPSEVKLIMIDPKVVELSSYNGIPHLMIPVVTDPKKAAEALNWAVAEMTKRYQEFAKYKVRDMQSYNEKVEETMKDKASGDSCLKKMAQIVIIVDELADLMMVAPGDVEEAICRLAQMARAAGLHLVIATQRPSVNVITGLIKANVPSRIAFSVASGVDSRTIIDMNGAEKLLGKGDMLFFPSGYPKPLRVQGCFVSDSEVQEIVKFLSEQENVIGGEQNRSIVLDAQVNEGQNKKQGEHQDEYFEQAARFIIEKEKASIGMLQREFKIGFNRAARIMEQLAQIGVVSEEEGTKPRRVLMTLEEFEGKNTQ